MKRIVLIFLYIAFGVGSAIHAFGDGYEKPKKYKFIFQNGDSIIFNNANDSLLFLISSEILNHKMNLASAYLTFESGERIIIDYNKTQLVSLKLADAKNEAPVPAETIAKIPDIHFETVTLFWIGTVPKAFDAGYFNIQFEVGREKIYSQYPYLEMIFTNKRYARSVIWQQVSDMSKQWTDF